MAQPLSYYSGLASGLDFYGLVDQMISIERRPAARLETNILQAKARQTELGNYRGLLRSVQDVAADFADGSALRAFSATVSGNKTAAGSEILAASATSEATPGSHTVEVQALAAAQKNIGSGQATSGDPLGLDGVFDLGGQQVTVTAADSLTAIRDRVNALNAGATPTGVTASILQVGAGDHRLVLTADETGTAHAFTPSDVSGTVAASLGLTVASTPAADALLVVDKVPVTRSSNVVDDVLEGVTLTLRGAEIGTEVDVKFDRYFASAQDSAQAFVDSYNAMVAYVKKQHTAGADGANPPLFSDPGLRSNRGAIASMLVGPVAGQPDDLNTLGIVGLELQRDGTLSLNTEKFKTAFDERFQDLEKVFADRGAALEGFLDEQLQAGTGALAVKEQAITESVASMEERVLTIDGRLERRRAALLRRFTSFEVEISRLQDVQKSMSAQFAQLAPKQDG